MSTTKRLSVKAVKPQDQTSVSKAQALIEVLQGSPTTPSNNLWTSTAIGTATANQIRQSVNRWPEVQTNCIEIKEHEAFNTSVATLLDLWLTRYGNEWIDLEDIENDEFFAIAYKRLKQMGELEQHYLTDRARYVCRKPE